MSSRIKAVPVEDSESEDDETVSERIKRLRKQSEREKSCKKFTGGVSINAEDHPANASTSARTSKLTSELDLKNTFSGETHRRDEDAEMNKYIDEQIKKRREVARQNVHQVDSDPADLFTSPADDTDKIDDIILNSLSKNLASSVDEKSEAMLSSQMLNGIPEVDLGINERIRTVEATEEAKFRLASRSFKRHKR